MAFSLVFSVPSVLILTALVLALLGILMLALQAPVGISTDELGNPKLDLRMGGWLTLIAGGLVGMEAAHQADQQEWLYAAALLTFIAILGFWRIVMRPNHQRKKVIHEMLRQVRIETGATPKSLGLSSRK